MKKIVYLAPVLLLSLIGKGVIADQNTHISHLDEGLMTNVSEPQPDQAAQNKDVVASEPNEVNKAVATHISSLDGNNVVAKRDHPSI